MLEEQLERGRQQWTIAWRRFARQWTQPQLLKLADAVMGGRYLHSSQISGFATGKLREPGPKVFLVIGKLNEAIAGRDIDESLLNLIKGKSFIAGENGSPLNASECFEVFSGIKDLGLAEKYWISAKHAEEASKIAGRFIRKNLTDLNIDYIEKRHDLASKYGKTIVSLMIGETVLGEEVIDAIPEIEKLLADNNRRNDIEALKREIRMIESGGEDGKTA